MSKARDFDLVLYGATGFVGRQTVDWLARHGRDLRWALAGRSAAKLEEVRQAAGEGAAQAGVIVADAHDGVTLGALASRARVVLSTAGPFALYGSELVAACVAHGTHYVDITGETPWVRTLMDRHHAQAAREGTRIIPCCGFDSVPSDLGTWLVQEAVLRQHNEPCVEVKACFSLRGGVNGGTLASALNLIDSGAGHELADPFLLNPPGQRPTALAGHGDPFSPHRDADFGAWVGPFFMGPVNTRVVRRSAALLGYGADFRYQEYLRFGAGAPAALAAAGLSIGMGAAQAAMRLRPMRRLAGALALKPGSGPSQATMDGGSFRCELVGTTATGKQVRGRISDSGDPGNRATTKFVCEAALTLVRDHDQLPTAAGTGGVMTPASGLGAPYATRLRAAGMVLAAPT